MTNVLGIGLILAALWCIDRWVPWKVVLWTWLGVVMVMMLIVAYAAGAQMNPDVVAALTKMTLTVATTGLFYWFVGWRARKAKARQIPPVQIK